MIRKFLNKVFNKSESVDSNLPSAAKTISAKKHKIDQTLISSAALKTCEGLHKAGFDVYIVGGAVRDLLL
ncbi:MAG: polynucleotide adenylyltransferase PcnB, partial [Methylophilaceae bacterium]